MTAMHDHGDPAELASLYCAGAMEPEQVVAFEAHLHQGCLLCNAEVAQFSQAMAALTEPDAVRPQSRVREQLMRRIATEPQKKGQTGGEDTQVWKRWADTPAEAAMVLVRAGDGAWEETSSPGVRVRRLFVDRVRNQFTGIVQMDAGSAYPKHVHDGPEECLVLEGELNVAGTMMYKGDYQYAPPGTLHGIQSTDRGCLLLITSSLTDELV